MTTRRVSKKDLRTAEMAPRRRYAALAVLRDGTPRLGGRVGRPVVWFEANHYFEDGSTGQGWRSDSDFTITGVIDGTPSLMVYVAKSKVETITFSMALEPFQFEQAIVGMRRNGLGRFVVPALREAQHQLVRHKRETPALRAFFRSALRPGLTRKSRARPA